MLQAIGTVRPALDNFYNSLTDEQKAAFDAIGPERNGATTALAADEETNPRGAHHRRHRHGYSVRRHDLPHDGAVRHRRRLQPAPRG